ncbi:DMT family transporter [Mycolicibacterium sp.]|uniref:DMT family transporter n=1 Tax=Mycolicibacterium sp. TaxID=2320850 RepID=UPI003D100E84
MSTPDTAPPRPTRWLFLGAAIASEVTGSLTMKAALDRPILYLIVVPGFLGSFFLLAAALRRGMPLAIAYGVWSAIGVALTTSLATVIYSEPFTPLMGVGIVLIIVGLLTVEFGSHPKSDAPEVP